MSGIALEVVVILLLLVVNGVFAMSETAVVAARRTRLEHRAEGGDEGARTALALAAHPNNFLSTVQVGITLVGVLAGALGGAGLADLLAARLAQLPRLAPYAEPVAFGVVVAAITYLSLIIGELVPKRIALGNPERVAALVARPMRLVSTVCAPLVALLTGSTNVVLRVLGIRASSDPGVTEQDIRAMVEQGAEQGAVAPVEHEIVENAFRLGDRTVGGIMTPRPDVRWLDAACPPDELRQQLADYLAEARGSRLLVCDDTVEEVLGVVHAEDLLARCLAGQPLDRDGLVAVLQPPLYVPTTMPAFGLLQQFRATRHDVAIALDEFGGVQGVVTVDDLVEAVVGELPERGEPDAPDIVREPGGSWLVDGDAAVEELDAALGVDGPADGARRGYHTAGGLVQTALGRVPRSGDAFDYAGHRVEVVAMEGRRVGRVRVQAAHAPRAADGAAQSPRRESPVGLRQEPDAGSPSAP
jgi:putative hemolysin